MSDTPKEFKAPDFQDGLVLYFHPYNFHSQKVLLTLYEKKIDFTPYVVDLSNGEQYSTWFLNLNPKGDVPVLQDGCFIIPDSIQILNYVEGKFRDEKYKTLIPKNLKSSEKEKMQLYEQIINRLPIGAISLGSFIHDDLKLSPKPPFIGPIRKACLKNNDKIHELLKTSVNKTDANSSALNKKIALQNRRKELVYNREEFEKLLDSVRNVLVYMDNELGKNSIQDWLILSQFTAADITLGLLLYRLYSLGFENYFWSFGKLPNIESYFIRFKNRESFIKLMPTSFSILKDIWSKTPSNYKIGAGAGVLGMAMFAALAHK